MIRAIVILAVMLALAACGGNGDVGRLPPDATSAETDREALVALYNATGGESWWRSDNWLSDAPIDEWRGVTTDENGRVVELHLRGKNLSGEIPPELGNLANLEGMYLHGNSLEGPIPPELGSLTNLVNLWLSENQLSGEIPPELGSLTSLVELELNDNELSGEIPPELGDLANLERLRLNDNQLSGCVPQRLKGQLVSVYLGGGLPFCGE